MRTDLHAVERYVALDGVDLFVRDVGAGTPLVVLHGGPDFDHTYLLPELDVLADACRLIYYDQRGRGRSAAHVQAADVGIESEVADLDELRRSLGLDSIAVLGHSWGALLAMEYAARHPRHVSHLILMNSAPPSARDWAELRRSWTATRPADDAQAMQAITAGAAYRAGDPAAEAAYYRIHFGPAVRRSEHLEQIVGRLRAHFTEQGVLLARDIEQRLYDLTCAVDGYDLTPMLRLLDLPALVLHGEYDFIPIELARHIADALPRARFVVVPGCGHFTYLERPDLVHQAVADLLAAR